MTTIRHIAHEAGVSVGTVSNVLNNPAMVSEDTRRRVMDVMHQHNYRPSAIARSLATRRTRTIGLIISSIFNPFSGELAHGASEQAKALACSLILASADYDGHDVPEHVETLLHHWVDGIFLASQPLPEGMLEKLDFGDTPLVIMDHGQTPPPNTVGLVGFEWEQAGYLATHHLVELGHRRIGYIGGIPDRSSTRQREKGYRQALDQAGLRYEPDLHVAGDFLTEGGYRCAMRLLHCPDRPTALVTANDMMALGALQAANALDLRVPQELSLVGMDDISFASCASPPLTTVRVPSAELGRVGLQMLLEAGDPKSPLRHVILPTELMVRRSTAAPAR